VIDRLLHRQSRSADGRSRRGVEGHGYAAARDPAKHAERKPTRGNREPGLHQAGVRVGMRASGSMAKSAVNRARSP
jgi:hypothetical protein